MLCKSKLTYIYLLFAIYLSFINAGNNMVFPYILENQTTINTENISQTSIVSSNPQTVMLGGYVLGYSFDTKGVLVVSTSVLFGLDNETNIIGKELKSGDIIISINDKEMSTSEQISKFVDKLGQKGEDAKIKFLRNGKEMETVMKPVYDIFADAYKIGVWTKDELSGVGTVTFIKSDGSFGALGHPITDSTTGKKLDVKQGKVYDCSVIGIAKSKYGMPGELRGVISRKSPLGSVDKNSNYGIYGDIDISKFSLLENQMIEVGGRSTVKPGKAQIYCALDGDKVNSYDIEIIKTNYQAVSNDKSLVFKITDKELIEKTGGIVQGMSGSPIVQNGKLVGAVTHVFVNDSTKGFGIYIDWMINN